jgi:hypothetical protein
VTDTDTLAPDTDRWLGWVALADVAEAPRNAKAHDTGAISRSVARFGYVEPMVLDERTGRLVAGHGRLAELRTREAQGEDAPDGIRTTPDGTWLVPLVRGWRSRSDAEADAAGLALNRVGESGGWDQGTLAELLAELATDPDLLDSTGFDPAYLDDLLAELGDAVVLPEQATDAEHAPLLPRGDPAEPRTVQGLREVGLMFSDEDHREYTELLVRLRRQWALDAAPQVVLRAMRSAIEP